MKPGQGGSKTVTINRSSSAERELDRCAAELLRRCATGVGTDALVPLPDDGSTVDLFESSELEDCNGLGYSHAIHEIQDWPTSSARPRSDLAGAWPRR